MEIKLILVKYTHILNNSPFIDLYYYRSLFINRDKGIIHRIGGPAVLLYEGDKSWWKNGKMHREDGPAEEVRDGRRIWWYEDKRIDCKNQEEFERIMKLRLFW